MQVTAKAYGKMLIFGAYAILEPGNIGLAVTINKGTAAKVQETHSGRVMIDLSNFEIQVQGVVKEGKLKLAQEDEMRFVRNAVKYSFEYLTHKGIQIRDIKLITVNDPELYIDNKLKTGFGSSATVTVATIAAILDIHDIKDREAVYQIARYSHYKSQGNLGSGYDISAACYGSQYFLAQDVREEWDFIKFLDSSDYLLTKQAFEWPQYLIPVIFFTGEPASTEKLIKKVMDFKTKNPYEYTEFIKRYNKVNLSLKEALDDNWAHKVIHFLEESWSMRRELGKMAHAPIENHSMTSLIKEVKSKGAMTAGLIGAGGGDSILALCESEVHRDSLIKFLKKKKYHVFEDLEISNNGFEILNL